MYVKAMFRLMLIVGSSALAAGCAPTYAPHLDVQPAPMLVLAPLDPPPQLPDAKQSTCPLGSGMAACFTLDQDLVRQNRFRILHDDRDYCRDAYERALTRCGGAQ